MRHRNPKLQNRSNRGPQCALQPPTQARCLECVKTEISESKEDYLKAVLEAESEGQTVISATLAHWLGVSPPAVTMAVRRLKKDGLVRVHTKGQVRLTALGRKIARHLALRHHLIERMLSEMF